MGWTEPSWWQHLLLENPVPGVVALMAAAVAAWLAASRQPKGRRRRMRAVALVCVALSIGLLALTELVETDHEQLHRLSEELVHATRSPIALDTVDRLLGPDAVLLGPEGDRWLSRDAIVRSLESLPGGLSIESHTITGLGVLVGSEGQRGQVGVTLRTYLTRRPGVPMPTRWTLTWRRDEAGRWRAHEIRWLEVRAHEPSRQMIP